MTQVMIDDALIQKARSVTSLTKDEDIVRVALEEYVLGGEARKEALALFGKMNWDPEFAGWDPEDYA
jgi:Arc/MetJ family transcription regulator